MLTIGRDLFRAEGIRGMYRGGLPLFLGGSLFRSAQFGFYENTMHFMKINGIEEKIIPGTNLDYRVVLAGFAGGVGRGLVEGPFEYIKVRRQVHGEWKWSRLYEGGSVTMLRNAFLFCSFSIYRAIVPPLFPEGKMPAFLEGAICANLAWFTIWPLDVVKSQRQSGRYSNKSSIVLLTEAFRTGTALRGLLPGLFRSTIANGCAMVVFKKTQTMLKESF
mgnify:FL=1|jgi:solute carrier family 25 (mitochondrial carnitine/acylcarnitine transporter), member 20/29